MDRDVAESYRRDVEGLINAQNVVCTPNRVIYCPCDDVVCEEFTNNFQVAYPKALAGKLCSVCPRFEGCKNK